MSSHLIFQRASAPEFDAGRELPEAQVLAQAPAGSRAQAETHRAEAQRSSSSNPTARSDQGFRSRHKPSAEPASTPALEEGLPQDPSRRPFGLVQRSWRRLYRNTPWYRWHLSSSKPLSLRRNGMIFVPGHKTKGEMIMDGRFLLAGERVDLVEENWFPHDAPQVWLRAMHGFDWLGDLRATEHPESAKAARHMVSSWLNLNKRWHPLSWDGEITAHRLLAWLGHFDFITHGANAAFVRRLTQEIAIQANHLLLSYQDYELSYARTTIEKALIFCGQCLPDGTTLASDMLGKLEESLDRLIRPDGGTQYRSPALQAALLTDLHDLLDFHRAMRLQAPSYLATTAQRMAPLMRMLIHNDGSVAHHNQSFALPPEAMASFMERCLHKVAPLKAAFASGLYRLTARRATLLIDGGAQPHVGFDQQAFAGTLSFEMTVGTQKLITNMGSHDRKALWGDVQRTTAAHSTLVLNDTNSSELVSGAGLGRKPQQVYCKPYETDDYLAIDLHHDGYRPLGGAKHYRSLKLARDGDYLQGEDLVTGPTVLPAVLRFHLHPQVNVALQGNRQQVVLYLPKGRPWRFDIEGAHLELEDSVYLEGETSARSRQIVARLPEFRARRGQAAERRALWSLQQLDAAPKA